MLLTITGLIALALAATARFRMRGSVNAAPLGWMSAQWLADYRAYRM
jgi:hypothetical protein